MSHPESKHTDIGNELKLGRLYEQNETYQAIKHLKYKEQRVAKEKIEGHSVSGRNISL